MAVGDVVSVCEAADDADFITAIKPRRNYIIRRASNLSKESHILAANLDRTLLVATLRGSPDHHYVHRPFLGDRRGLCRA